MEEKIKKVNVVCLHGQGQMAKLHCGEQCTTFLGPFIINFFFFLKYVKVNWLVQYLKDHKTIIFCLITHMKMGFVSMRMV